MRGGSRKKVAGSAPSPVKRADRKAVCVCVKVLSGSISMPLSIFACRALHQSSPASQPISQSVSQ